jgi:hypothetical protein
MKTADLRRAAMIAHVTLAKVVEDGDLAIPDHGFAGKTCLLSLRLYEMGPLTALSSLAHTPPVRDKMIREPRGSRSFMSIKWK